MDINSKHIIYIKMNVFNTDNNKGMLWSLMEKQNKFNGLLLSIFISRQRQLLGLSTHILASETALDIYHPAPHSYG